MWSRASEIVFVLLKDKIRKIPILKHCDIKLETIIETNSSDYMVSYIIQQKHLENANSALHLIAFPSQKIYLPERNYGIGDKELLAIVACLKNRQIYLYPFPGQFSMFTTDYNL